MHHTNKNRRGLAGSTAATRSISKRFKRTNYGRMACTCQGRMTCNTCTHFAAIALAGAGYRAWWPRAQAVALSLALGLASTSGTIAASRKNDPVHSNTLKQAVATSTESGVLSCPNSGAGRNLCAATPDGFGQGGLVRKAGRVTCFTFETPCPPDARSNANGGFSVSQQGA